MPGRPDARVRALTATAVALVFAIAACGSGSSSGTSSRSAPAGARPDPGSSSGTTVPSTASSAPLVNPPSTAGASTDGPAEAAPEVEAAAPSAPAWLADTVDAGQAVVVTAPDYGATTATLATYERTGAGWHAVSGSWPARVGVGGLAPPGEKTEGDGRTPSGTFGFDFLFGLQPDPGVRLPYRQVTGPSIVWDDDPVSPRYNQWVDQAVASTGADPEPMFQSPAYDYGAVIAYNTARTPGLGSAIFLHVSTGGPTAGCVSLPEDRLLEVLRWLDPGQRPVVIMGVAGT